MPFPPACTFDLSGVAVVYGEQRVLAAVDLHIAAGERVALVGPSGAGKTTLLRLLNGTLRPAAGSVVVDGVDLTQLPSRALRAVRARVGFVHQDHALVPNLRVSTNVLAGRLGRFGFFSATRSLLWPARSALAEVYDLLQRVGIGAKLFERTDQLSGGQRQRVAIARALYQQPAALLADEPLASVDPARSRDLLQLLDALARERGITFVCSLHDFPLAREYFPRLIGLREGRILFDLPTGQIKEEHLQALYHLDEQAVSESHA